MSNLARKRDEQSERVAITLALEALEGADQAGAVEILLATFEDAFRPEDVRRFPCPECGLGFEWPGLRDAHVDHAHPYEAMAA